MHLVLNRQLQPFVIKVQALASSGSVVDPGFLKGGFNFSLTKTPAQFELKTTKKRLSTFILLSRQYFTFITG